MLNHSKIIIELSVLCEYITYKVKEAIENDVKHAARVNPATRVMLSNLLFIRVVWPNKYNAREIMTFQLYITCHILHDKSHHHAWIDHEYNPLNTLVGLPVKARIQDIFTRPFRNASGTAMSVLSVRKHCLELRCGLLGLVDWVMFVLSEDDETRLFQCVRGYTSAHYRVCGESEKTDDEKWYVSIKLVVSPLKEVWSEMRFFTEVSCTFRLRQICQRPTRSRSLYLWPSSWVSVRLSPRLAL